MALRLIMRDPMATIAAGIAIAVFAVGLNWGTNAAGGSDSYCYISQAELFAQGRLRLEPPVPAPLIARLGTMAFVPVGHRPAVGHRGSTVPICPPGLSIVMALFRVAGGANAIFLVVPLFGAAAIWLTFLMGRLVGGPLVGLAGAALLAVSPVFLYQLVQPMTDVPVTALWLLAFVLAARSTATSAFAAGLASSAALLTRPNLLLPVIVPGLLAASGAMRHQSRKRRGVAIDRELLRRAAAFAAGVIPGCLTIAALNNAMYGSPFLSGYGSLSELFSVSNAAENSRRYLSWLLDVQTPLVLLALPAPFVLSRESPVAGFPPPRVMSSAALIFAALVIAGYLPYSVFDHWSYLRFLLPVLPGLLITVVAVVASLVVRTSTRAAHWIVVLFTAALIVHSVLEVRTRHVFDLEAFEARFVEAGRFVAEKLPANAAMLTEMESGSIRHYAGRATMGWQPIAPDRLDETLEEFRDAGYRPYILLEAGEDEAFRTRFGGRSSLGALDWPPLADIRTRVPVRIYDPAARADHLRGQSVRNEVVWPESDRRRKSR